MPDQRSATQTQVRESKPRQSQPNRQTVALYVTCLINSLRPNIGFACVRLIESLGFQVFVPPDQTCCGQPGYNGGQRAQAQAVAKSQIRALEGFDHIVVPSGSCAGMIINHYPKLLADEPEWLSRAEALAARTKELCQFLVVHHWQPGIAIDSSPSETNTRTWAYHTSCSCRRETRSHEHGQQLLTQVGLDLAPLPDKDVCCGFGGAFAAKFDALSAHMGRQKLAAVEGCGANAVTAADLGCLLQLQSLAETGSTGLQKLEFRHLAELLAEYVTGEADSP